MKPGFIFGKDYEDLIDHCKTHKFALPAVNVTSTNTANAVLESAAKNKSDVIIQVSNGGAHFFGGPSLEKNTKTMILGAKSLALHVQNMAQEYGIGVILHTDHASKEYMPWIDGLIDLSIERVLNNQPPLFSSHMLDLSAEPLEYNIEKSRYFLQKAKKANISMEFEIGITGGEEDGVGTTHDENADNSHLYSKKEDIFKFYTELLNQGHYTTAVAFGNVHGVYKPGSVKLKPEILKETQEFIEKHAKTEKKTFVSRFSWGIGVLKRTHKRGH